MARPKKKKEEKISPVVVVINFPDHTLKGEGKTVLEAIEAIDPPIKIFTKGTIRITDGVRSLEETWFPVRMKRLFRPLSQGIVAKELEYLMS